MTQVHRNLGLPLTLGFLLVFASFPTAKADEGDGQVLLDEADASIDRLNELIAEAQRLADKDSGEGEAEAGDEVTKPAAGRTWHTAYYFWKREKGEGPLRTTTLGPPKGCVSERYRGPLGPAPPGMRRVFWVLRLTYTVRGYARTYSSEDVQLHMTCLKPGEDAEKAIQGVMASLGESVGVKGDLRDPFLTFVARELDSTISNPDQAVTKWEAEKLAGPFDAPDAGRGTMAEYYFSKAGEASYFGEIARGWQSNDSETPLYVVWDNPWTSQHHTARHREGMKYYLIFWDLWGN